jgi:YD repeat-containing protein
LTGTSTTGPSGSSTASYSYDAAGNTLTRGLPSGKQTLTWTHDGKLATAAVLIHHDTNRYTARIEELIGSVKITV